MEELESKLRTLINENIDKDSLNKPQLGGTDRSVSLRIQSNIWHVNMFSERFELPRCIATSDVAKNRGLAQCW